MLNHVFWRKISSVMTLALLCIQFGAYSFAETSCSSDSSKVYVDPPKVVDEALVPATRFTIFVKVSNAPADPGIVGIEFKLTWDSTLLNAEDMDELFFHETMPVSELDNLWKIRHNVENSSVRYAYTYQDTNRAITNGYAPVAGNQTIARVTFKVKGFGETTIHFETCKLGSTVACPIQTEIVDGFFSNGKPTTSLKSLVLLGAGAKWATKSGSSALFVNWQDNWLAHHLADGAIWGPWPTALDIEKWSISVTYALDLFGINVHYAADIPEDLNGYDVIVIHAYWAVEPRHEPIIRDFVSNGGGVVLLSGVPEFLRCYCKDMWTYSRPRENSSLNMQEWFGSESYENTGGHATVTVDSPFGTGLLDGDTLVEGLGYSNAAVGMLHNDTQVVAKWGSGQIFAYSHEFGQGRVYYQATFENLPPVSVQSISVTPEKPEYDDDVVVSAVIKDHAEVSQALLSFTSNSEWQNISMSKLGVSFTSTIPSQPYKTFVQYRIYAVDENGYWIKSETHSYTVTDSTPPAIQAVQCAPEHPSANDTVVVTANVTEPSEASGVNLVLFSFKDSFAQWWNTTMTYDNESGLWTAIVPLQPHNITIDFYIIASDNAGNLAVADNFGAPYSYNVLAEFSSFVIVPIFLTITLLAVVARKRNSSTDLRSCKFL